MSSDELANILERAVYVTMGMGSSPEIIAAIRRQASETNELRAELVRSQAEAKQLHADVLTLAHKLATCAEVLGRLAEKRRGEE
jgi:hypothetical protein